MSPTLLELVVVLLLLWLAWQIAKLLAPRFLASLLTFWRSPAAPPAPDQTRREKNVTPPAAMPRKNPPHAP